MSDKERKKVEAAHVVAARSKALPVKLRRKAFLISCTALAVASWGWLLSGPPNGQTRRLEASWRSLWCVDLPQASVSLLKVLSGHRSDLGFSPRASAFSALRRGVQHRGLAQQGWDVSLAVRRLRSFMYELAFSVVRPWVWSGRGYVRNCGVDSLCGARAS